MLVLGRRFRRSFFPSKPPYLLGTSIFGGGRFILEGKKHL